MLLFCKYGVDPSDSTSGIVIAHYDDDRAPPREAHPGCIIVPYDLNIETLPKFGPEPAEGATDWRLQYAAPRLDVDVAQSAKLAELKAACGAAITAGFTSSALGTENVYPSTEEDQRNLALAANTAATATKSSGWSTDLKCAPAGRRAVRVSHTAAQVQTVLGDFVAFKGKIMARYDKLKAAVAAAADPDAVAAITWG